jgi:L-cysteine desulfidase
VNDYFHDVWELAKQAGPFASILLLLILYFVNEERKEAIKEIRSLNEKNSALVERILKGMYEVNITLKTLSDLLSTGRKR